MSKERTLSHSARLPPHSTINYFLFILRQIAEHVYCRCIARKSTVILYLASKIPHTIWQGEYSQEEIIHRPFVIERSFYSMAQVSNHATRVIFITFLSTVNYKFISSFRQMSCLHFYKVTNHSTSRHSLPLLPNGFQILPKSYRYNLISYIIKQLCFSCSVSHLKDLTRSEIPLFHLARAPAVLQTPTREFTTTLCMATHLSFACGRTA